MPTLPQPTKFMQETPSALHPADSPAVIAHVGHLQAIISRLASNSATCKTWCLTLVAALVSLAGAIHAPALITFCLVPVILFGLLDAMYLAQDNAYRDLYASVIESVRDGSYSLAAVYEARAPLTWAHLIDALISWSLIPIYAGLVVAYLVSAVSGWLAVLSLPSH